MFAILLLGVAVGPSLPADLRLFIARREACNHWAGEEGHNASRRRQIERAFREGRCAELGKDETAIRERYRDTPDMLAILDQVDESYGTPD